MNSVRLFILIICFAAGAGWGVPTGHITASPHHLVIAPGTTDTATITWTTTNCSTAQVYVSAPGGNESLVSQNANGSISPSWIVSEQVYIFKLYEGTSHATLLDWVSVTSHRPPDNMFGFNYWPAGNSCSVLTDANWTQSMKDEVEADLDHMSSLSAGVLRLFFWPQNSGFIFDTPLGSGGVISSDFYEICDNLPELLAMCAERDMRVAIAFGNNYLKNKQASSGLYWWEVGYGTNGWSSFLNDSETWMSNIVSAVQNSSYASTVIYYDFLNETDNDVSNIWTYVNYMYDNVGVLKGRRGLSFLDAAVDAAYGASNLGHRRLDYADFHCYYPDGVNSDLSAGYAAITNSFPDTTVLVGEYGRKGGAATFDDEDDQQTEELDVVDDALAVGVPYFMHWMLWDNSPPSSVQVHGFGYDPDTAKHVMGSMSEVLNLALNPDMEDQDVSGEPMYWNTGGTSGTNPVLTNPGYYSGASSNYRYARVTAAQPGSVWMTSQRMDVDGGGTLYVNSYIKSSMTNIVMNVVEYDSSDNITATTAGASFTPEAWQWYNYLHNTGSWNVDLRSDTVKVLVSITAVSPFAGSIMDVDTVSVWQR